MNWKFWQNQKAKVAVPVTAAAIVVVAAGIAVAVHFIQPGMITQQQAQSIALEHAGVREEDALALKVSRDDGKYDVSFRTADRTYEYEIQGRSGQVVRPRPFQGIVVSLPRRQFPRKSPKSKRRLSLWNTLERPKLTWFFTGRNPIGMTAEMCMMWSSTWEIRNTIMRSQRTPAKC